MKRILTVLTLMFIHLCGHSQVTTYKEVDRYNNEGTANNVVVLQMNDDSLPFDPDLTQEARKHRGHQNLTVVFYRASAALLPAQVIPKLRKWRKPSFIMLFTPIILRNRVLKR